MSTKPSPAPIKTSAVISRRTFLTTSAAAGGALVVGLTLRGRLHHPSSGPTQDPFNAWIRVKNGMIQQQNFNSYDLLRMPDAPQLETYLVEGGRPPGGIGEPPLALIGPSVGNAIFAATGKRLRKLPFHLDEVLR